MMRWKLNRVLFLKFNITRPAQLRRFLLERANFKVSLQTAVNIMRGPSKELRLDLLQALCDACHVNSYEIFEVTPSSPEELAVRLDGATASPYRPRDGSGDDDGSKDFYPDLDLYLYRMDAAETPEPDGGDAANGGPVRKPHGEKRVELLYDQP